MKALDVITWILLIVGGINWGLIGLFDFNLVTAIFGEASIASRIVYVLVGLSALYDLLAVKAIQHRWVPMPSTTVRETP